MAQHLTSDEIGKGVQKILASLPKVKKLQPYLNGNFGNCNKAIFNVIAASDGEIRSWLFAQVFKTVEDDLQQYRTYDVFERDKYSKFGLMLMWIRFGLGYIGNFIQGEVLPEDERLAIVFAYEAYWEYGDDYLLGSLVESFMQQIPADRLWVQPSAEDFADEKSRKKHQRTREAVLELQGLARFHRLMQPSMEHFRSGDLAKPERKDFR